MDPIVLSAPLLALAVVALLGFAGWGFESSAPAPLTLRARVPSTLAVTRLTFRWTPPGGMQQEAVLPDPATAGTEGTEALYEHPIPPAGSGAWMTFFQIRVREGNQVAQVEATGDSVFDFAALLAPKATYQASGSPSGGDFTVTFVGLLEGAMV